MKVLRNDRDGVAVLRLEGEFDSFETELVRDGLEACMTDGRNNIAFDLENLQFANSTTIAYFITAQKRVESAGGRLVMARPSDFLQKALVTLGLDRVFTIVESVDDAVAALKST